MRRHVGRRQGRPGQGLDRQRARRFADAIEMADQMAAQRLQPGRVELFDLAQTDQDDPGDRQPLGRHDVENIVLAALEAARPHRARQDAAGLLVERRRRRRHLRSSSTLTTYDPVVAGSGLANATFMGDGLGAKMKRRKMAAAWTWGGTRDRVTLAILPPMKRARTADKAAEFQMSTCFVPARRWRKCAGRPGPAPAPPIPAFPLGIRSL